MAETFSQSVTGINAGSSYAAKSLLVGDTDAAGDAITKHTRSWQGPMSRGNQVLCQNPDGSQSWYTMDAERSFPGGALVMRPVGP